MKKLGLGVLSFLITLNLLSQAPRAFNYQGVIRNSNGEIVSNKQVTVKFSIINKDASITYYSESVVTITNGLGIVNAAIGSGDIIAGSFSDIPWITGDIYLKVEIMPEGSTGFTDMGIQKLLSVPYALFASDGISVQWMGSYASAPANPSLNQAYYNTTNKISYIWDGDSWEILAQDGQQGPPGPLVAGTTGQTLHHDGTSWAASSLIFNNATNVGVNTLSPSQRLDVNGNFRLRGLLFDYNNSSGTSGQYLSRGGSGVVWQTPNWVTGSGVSGQMAVWNGATTLTNLPNLTFSQGLVVVGNPTANPDDPIFEVKNSNGDVIFGVYQEGVRINIKDDAIKGAKGGFAVGGLTNQTKDGPVEYLRITPDSARIYIKQEVSTKGAKGGFAVGGLTNQTKAVVSQDLLFINPDSARIYLNENPVKGAKGGFAVGGLTNGKGNAQLIQLTKENYLIGYEAGASMSSGVFNSFLGYQAGKNNSTGNLNTFLGYQAGLNNQGSDNTFIGYQAGMVHTSKGGNVYIGSKAGANAVNGERNVLIGESAGYSISSGTKNVFIGFETGYNTTTGYNNVFLGTMTGYANTTGRSNVYIGDSTAVKNTNGSKNVFLGNYAGLNNTGGNNNVYIGFEAGYSGQWASQNICIGNYSGYSNTTNQNLFIGEYAGEKNTTGTRNSFVGFFAGQNNLTGGENSYFGQFAGKDNTKSYNTFIGYWAGGNNVNGEKNAFLGYRSGQGSNGSNNVFLGSQAGEGNTGSNNVLIGYQAGYNTGNISNVLYIANSSSSLPLIYGNFSTGNVGLGTVSPDKKLHVVGDARVTGDIYYGTEALTYIKPDFVFNPDYNEFYDPLSVERFIRKNGHLPWLTKASEEKDGINLTRMQFETVEAVENLQLQIIQQQKEIEELKRKNSEIEVLKSELESLKALLQAK